MKTLFPTLIHQARPVADDALKTFNAELEAAIWMLADGDEAGQDWCEANGYPGYTSYASLNDLPKRAGAFAALKKRLDPEAALFAEAVGWDMAGRRLRLDSYWVNVLEPGGIHSGHIHPLSVISGTYYVTIPDGASAIRFEDPRLPLMMAAPAPRGDANEAQKRSISIAPRPGDMLMWESWLRHEVPLNMAEAPRLSISFNYALA
jgi:uncharacterized protein (TIGR02466 family)